MRLAREPARHNQQTYMVTTATWGRRNLFQKEPWVELFIETLLRNRPSAYLLHEFVCMPDHIHVLITPAGALERAVQFLKGGFSRRASVELNSRLDVWQKGFSDHRIRDSDDYQQHLTYIRQNPVRARLCETPEQYAWSSASGRYALDPVPQRLKPLTLAASAGAAEAAPFQSRTPEESEDGRFQRRTAEQSEARFGPKDADRAARVASKLETWKLETSKLLL